MTVLRLLLFVSAALFSVGLYGVLTRRHAIGMLLALELMLNAAALNTVVFAWRFGQVEAQAFALFIIALAAAEAVVGLAVVLRIWRTAGTVLADRVDLLQG